MIPAIRVQFDIGSLLDEVEKLRRAINDEMFKAMEEVSKDIAEEARQQHHYHNRTGNLEASTQPLEVYGTFDQGNLVGGVLADTDYAEYVDGRPEFAFLQPALDRVEPHIDQILESHLEAAAGAAGW